MILDDMQSLGPQTDNCRQASFTTLDEDSASAASLPRYLRSAAFARPDSDEPFAELSLRNMIAKKSANRLHREGLVSVSTLRSDLVCFIGSLCSQLQYAPNTFHLAVAYLDYVFGQYSIKEAQGRVLAYSALMLAAKLEENVEKIPAMADTVAFFDNQFSEESLVFFERVIAECLSFQLNLKTPFAFLNAYLSLGVVREDECSMAEEPLAASGIVATLESVGALFVEVGARSYDFNRFDSQTVAASAVVCARSCLGFETTGESLLERLRVKWTDIEGCVGELLAAAKLTRSECYFRFQEQIDGLQTEIRQLQRARKGGAEGRSAGRQSGVRTALQSACKERLGRSARKSAGRPDEDSFQPVTPAKETGSKATLGSSTGARRGRRGVDEPRTV